MTTRAMTPVDAAWLHIDGPANPAMVTSIMLTRTPLDFDRVKSVYERRLVRFERFRQRVVDRRIPLAAPQWEDMPGFRIDQHLHHIALPPPHDRAALAELVGDLASTPLDRERPLWQVHLIDQVDGGSALVTRFHHCLADGSAILAVSRELFDTTPDGWLESANLSRTAGARSHGKPRAQGMVDRWFGLALDVARKSASTLTSTVDAAVDVVRHPEASIERAGQVIGGLGMLAAKLLEPPDPPSPLKGEFGMRKRLAWSEPVALDDVKAIGAGTGAKINDVLVAAMTGALRSYLKGRGVDVDRTTLRAMVPVDLRPPERAGELGNAFGLVILDLAVGKRTAAQRLRVTQAHMDALKRSSEAVGVLTLFHLFGRAPKAVEDFAVDLFGSRASLVMTNVAGPRETLYLAGVPVDRVMFWVPHPGRQLGMGISILSYRGSVTLAVIADAHLVPDPEAITRGFDREFTKMLAASRRGEFDPTSGAKSGGRATRSAARTAGQPGEARAARSGRSRSTRREYRR